MEKRLLKKFQSNYMFLLKQFLPKIKGHISTMCPSNYQYNLCSLHGLRLTDCYLMPHQNSFSYVDDENKFFNKNHENEKVVLHGIGLQKNVLTSTSKKSNNG